MTTIAYRYGTIAADTGMCIGDARIGQTRKIAKTKEAVLVGGAGHAGFVSAFLKWVEAGEPKDQCPLVYEDEDAISRAFIVRPDTRNTFHVFEPSGCFDVLGDYYALGSGREIALGVFFKGGSARDAVAAAMLHDRNTWGELQQLSFPMNDGRV